MSRKTIVALFAAVSISNAAKQKISDGQAGPEFQENRERLKAERLAREAGRKAKGK